MIIQVGEAFFKDRIDFAGESSEQVAVEIIKLQLLRTLTEHIDRMKKLSDESPHIEKKWPTMKIQVWFEPPC